MVDQPLRNFKTIIVGNSGVGKSTILLRYTEGQFSSLNTTVAVDYKFKKVVADGKTFNLQLWDTAGQERYKTIVFSFFKLSKAAVIVFDITHPQSLKDVKGWMEQLDVQCGKQIPKILLANKSDMLSPADLKNQLQILQPKIDQLRKDYNCELFVVSAKTGENVDKSFQYLAQKLAKQMQNNSPPPAPARITFKLDDPQLKDQKKRKRDKCCS